MEEPDSIPFDLHELDREASDLTSGKNTLGILLGILFGSALLSAAAYCFLR